jgi:site-specific DNA-methyltransferase (adenine-specific)
MEQLHPRGPTANVSTCTAECVAPAQRADAPSALAPFQVRSREMKRIILGDNAEVLPTLPASFARLVYIDPPFNTGKVQKRDRIRATATDGEGSRGGFGGRRYDVERVESGSYDDAFDDFEAFLMPRVEASLRCMTADGSIFVHLDFREVHHIKVALDALLGRERFMNEIIWAYDYGGRAKNRWPAKHDTILWYALDPDDYVFNFDAMDRIPYMAPGLVSPEKAERGKTPTDVWWQTIVPTNGREKTGYPTQKPIAVLNRIVRVHSHPGDVVLDFFAGSGTSGDAAARHGRGFVLVDSNPEAVNISATRLSEHHPTCERLVSADTPASAQTSTL